MKRFNAGAPRQATDGARLSAAQSLVQRTLAQHGLMPPPDGSGTSPMPALPSLDRMLAQFAGPGGAAAATPDAMPVGATFESDTYTCAAGSRAYRTYVPASAAQGLTGVIMMLHGCTQTPEDFAAGTGMNALAEEHRLVIVYPKQSRGDNAQSCWNWFSRGDQQRGRGEPAILAGLAAHVGGLHGIGRDATFVAGLSAGAAMAVILGEAYGDVFAAVGAHSGLPVGAARDVPSAFAAMAGNATGQARPPQIHGPVRTIIFHGTADPTVHPSNGEAIARRAIDAYAPQSIESSLTEHRAGRQVNRVISCGPDGTAIVEHWAIEGQGHAWSGGRTAGTYTDPTGPDASAEMIRFFFETSHSDQ
ncbi:extracellular catalytic domain type 1 short-chain-length polyhydroxyalkanoate depolymerase [Flavimaricola marinus]|uniref:Esterase PHB depolymerase n=1 Tax=Flavimaricola marinus TaxID=1819565 RepID=A0A238LDJ4_9RHOB|nr:PHB depolymerase family esterase [Flavimaricola marinus]SMY07000.1 Esterase PHB depolymerase [Flavimaricola marinus]